MTDTGNTASGRTLADVEAGLDMPLQEAMLTQRAVRRVLPDPVDDAVVRRCIELALKAPTGSNGQNWEFVVVRDAATKAKLATQSRRAFTLYERAGQRMSRTAEDESQANILRAVRWQVEHFEEIPVLVVCCLRGGRVPWMPAPSLIES